MADIIGNSDFVDLVGIGSPADIQVILDGRASNLAATTVEGFDIDLSYSMASPIGELSFSAYMSFLESLEQRATADSISVDLVDTFGNPASLRARASATWLRSPWSLTTSLNYIDSYKDQVSSPARSVDSWTTVDFRAAYEFSFGGFIKDLSVSIAITNLLDTDPPFVNNPDRVGYDPANADPFGRFATLGIGASF